jgi:hypothetical protein
VIDPVTLDRLRDASAPWRWKPNPPATPGAIAHLVRAAPAPLPPDYVALLRACDGGEGALGLPPLWLVLWNAAMVVDHGVRDAWPGLLAFGTNGGDETIAFEMLDGRDWPIVAYEPAAGADSVRRIAPDVAAFVDAIGLDAEE